LDMGARTITSIEAMKTIAYEISEQLLHKLGTDVKTKDSSSPMWCAPDWYIQSVSGGMGPIGVYKGFHELEMMHFVEHIPAIAAIQSEGCAPMVAAWKAKLSTAEPVLSPRTHIETLATGDPGRSYTLLSKIINDTQGIFEQVSDEEAYRAMHVLAKMEGISAEPAAGVGFAGLFKLIRSGVIKPTDVIVVNCTGHTMPTEPYILGDDWVRNIEMPSRFSLTETPQEGLLAALSRVAPDRFPSIVIVDDSPEARRLIRRILQSQGNYTIHEAENGREALNLVEKENPDLIILDLMMPDMDGFAVLDNLKTKPETADIPVIVSTAKELTKEEKTKLKGRIQSLMQKGDFLSDEFQNEVRALLG
jgi:threonine synthase